MYINRGDFSTDIYPFADNEAEASMTDRIVVIGERVRWNSQHWTPEDVADYLAKLSAAFDKAFELASTSEAQP